MRHRILYALILLATIGMSHQAFASAMITESDVESVAPVQEAAAAGSPAEDTPACDPAVDKECGAEGAPAMGAAESTGIN